ncbi:hypothetical protein VCHENC02_3919 [Vibrio harveyi]|uniref:Uncharacterized protein n=1 Tax=Vibrio harveyi TaxID=669 RepID=A0A454CV85_VIBHA|nr:hypothetical protein VCHENC02_3919 [Vibrio harveyi]
MAAYLSRPMIEQPIKAGSHVFVEVQPNGRTGAAAPNKAAFSKVRRV